MESLNKILKKSQKIVLLVFVFSGIATVIMALVYSSRIIYMRPDTSRFDSAYTGLFQTIYKDKYLTEMTSAKNAIFDVNQTIQTANDTIFYLGLVVLIVSAIMIVLGNISRKKYYISNLVAGIAAPVIAIGYAIVALIQNIAAKNAILDNHTYLFLQNELYNKGDYDITVLPMNFATIFLIILMISSVAVIAHTTLKYLVTRKNNEKVGA